jgi:hypothetical protein
MFRNANFLPAVVEQEKGDVIGDYNVTEDTTTNNFIRGQVFIRIY